MYYNNNDNRKDSDLKFIPLSITEAFTEKDSAWFPIIDMALPAFSEIPNSFAFNFNTPMDNSNIQKSSLNTLDYIQNNNSNLQNNMKQISNMQQIPNIQQNQNMFEKDFDLDYPSEIFSEELKSYNKNEKCKSNNSNLNNQNQNNQNQNNQNQNLSNQNNENLSNQNLNNQNQNLGNSNLNNQNLNSSNFNNANTNTMINSNKQNVNSRDYIEEPIHMELLRGLNFENYLYKDYRGEESEKMYEVDRIFNLIKSDSSIIDTFKAYNIPRPIYEVVIKKIVKTSLENLSNNWRG